MAKQKSPLLCAWLIVFTFIGASVVSAKDYKSLVYEGTEGPGKGKHIVFLAGDHEYRSEETLPALARILAKHHGFKCTVLFTIDKKTGEIVPGSNYMPGTKALDDADLMVIFLRFQNFPADQMQPIVDYLAKGKPIVGLRTSTHAFRIPKTSPYAKFSWQYDGEDMPKGFGRQILGETWVSHYGKNHQMSTRLDINPEHKSHPILTGVKNPWVECGGYWVVPKEDSTTLVFAQPLVGMKPDSKPAADKKPCPGAWIREYEYTPGKKGRVFNTTYGASEDLKNDGFRRMMLNSCMWAIGLEEKITSDLNIDFVGPYQPVTFRNKGHVKGVKPLDLAGWDSPIMPAKMSEKK